MSVIHEGEHLDNIVKIASAITNGVKKGLKDSKSPYTTDNYLGGSISNYTKNLILTFPVLCDNSLPASTASMISKANERNIVSMLQMLFASMQLNGTNGKEVLSSIHKNINFNASMDDIVDQLSEWNESAYASNSEINTAIREMVEELKKEPKRFPSNNFSESSLNDYTVLNIMGNTVVREARGQSQEEIDNLKADTDRKTQQYQNDKELHPYNVDKAGLQNTNTAVDIIRKQLLDTDVKKANELQPTLMIVNYNEVDPANGGKIYDKKSFISGVKSRLISVDSMDIIERIAAFNKTKINFVNFIRATSGEIKFGRDFLFAVNQNKLDAKNSVKKGSAAQLWKTLEMRGSKNYFNKAKRVGNDASAITSLVLSQETVNALRKEYDIDVEQISTARSILNNFNLLAIFICDESIEVVKSMYAGADSWEQNAYSSLERESNDNSYKKVINLMGKINGR